jgi:phage shock protein E
MLKIILISACSSNVSNKTIEQAHNAVKSGAKIIDVRTHQEYTSGHIQGALNIPISMLQRELPRLEKSQTYVLYCRSGNRSGQAERLMRQYGYNAINVETQADWNRELK